MECCVLSLWSCAVLQSLKEEFSQQEALLSELEDHVTQYRQQGKMEASARLEQQTQLLKVGHLSVETFCLSFKHLADLPFFTRY